MVAERCQKPALMLILELHHVAEFGGARGHFRLRSISWEELLLGKVSVHQWERRKMPTNHLDPT